MPVSAQIHIRYDHGIHYRIRFRAAGVSFARKLPQNEPTFFSSTLMKTFPVRGYRLLFDLLRQGAFKRLLKRLTIRNAEWRIRVSLADAAQTAVLYVFLRTIWQTAQMICAPAPKANIEADFQSAGLQFSFRCIVSARLGRITAEAVRLWLISARMQDGRLKAEEANYAAAPH